MVTVQIPINKKERKKICNRKIALGYGVTTPSDHQTTSATPRRSLRDTSSPGNAQSALNASSGTCSCSDMRGPRGIRTQIGPCADSRNISAQIRGHLDVRFAQRGSQHLWRDQTIGFGVRRTLEQKREGLSMFPPPSTIPINVGFTRHQFFWRTCRACKLMSKITRKSTNKKWRK